jgi:hypothetical protein
MNPALTNSISAVESLRFSGHESFACRYAWLTKAYRGLSRDATLFADEDSAMVELGIGKNMVRSLRFWVEAAGLAAPEKRGELALTDFAHAVFGRDGVDPYLEDARTLWLLHWNVSSRSHGALFAWRYLLNQWALPELTRSEALAAFKRESTRLGHAHSEVTLSQHLDVFLHTYRPSRSSMVGLEDSLDGPLVELALIQIIGERKVESGRWEPVLAFRREPKAEITAALFEYCLRDWWQRFRPDERTLTLREVALGLCSPGQVFKLPEEDIRARLEAYSTPEGRSGLTYQPSAVQGLLSRVEDAQTLDLRSVFAQETVDA